MSNDKSLRNILRAYNALETNREATYRARNKTKSSSLGWIGHTLRRSDGHVVKGALEWNPQEKRAKEGETIAHLAT